MCLGVCVAGGGGEFYMLKATDQKTPRKLSAVNVSKIISNTLITANSSRLPVFGYDS